MNKRIKMGKPVARNPIPSKNKTTLLTQANQSSF